MTLSTKPIRHGASYESGGPAASYVDVAGAFMDLASGGAFAQFGAKGPGSVGAKFQSVLAGVIKDALAAAANGDLTTVGQLTVAKLLDLSAAAAGQVKFPAAQNASSDANTLDDYEEGSWTPAVGGSATYTTQSGRYIKVGRLVFAYFNLSITAIGTGSQTSVTGLPYALGSSASYVHVGYFNGAALNVGYIAGIAGGSSSGFTFYSTAAAGTGTNAQNVIGSGTDIRGYVVYEAGA